MSVPTPFFGFSLLLSILVFAGCQIRPSCASNDALQPGETIWVCNAKHVVKTEDTEARILADGTVTLPFIGAVRLAGLTISEAERTVQDAFRVASFYTQPQVRILREHAKLNVIDIVGRLSYRVIESRIAEDDEFPLGPGGVRPYALTKLITNKPQYQVQKCGEDSVQIVYTPQTWIIHIRYRVAPETRVHGLYFKTVRDHEFYHVEIIKIFLQQLEEAMSSFSKCECLQCMSQKRQMVDAYTKSIGLAMAATHAKFDCNDYFGPSTPDNARGARCREARSLYESLRKANADYLNLQRDWLACKYGEKR